ncbi:hypothetical protein RSAG8_03395, partial [Rhizoctonia solani AG-8 WAC10335]
MFVMPHINGEDSSYVPDIWFTNQADNSWDDLTNFLNCDPLATLPSEEVSAPSWMEDFQLEQYIEAQLSPLEPAQTETTIPEPVNKPEPSPSLSPVSAPPRTPSPVAGPVPESNRYDSPDARWQAVLDRAQTTTLLSMA